MAHRIKGNRFVIVAGSAPAWHRIERARSRPDALPSEVAVLCGADFAVDPREVYFQDGDRFISIPNRYALVRPPLDDEPLPVALDVVSDQYEVLQNTVFVQHLDRLAQLGWTVETAAVLQDGAQFFVCFRVGEFDLLSQQHTQFFVASTYHRRQAIEMFDTNIKAVCHNTYTAGLQSAQSIYRIPHNRGVTLELDWATQIMAAAQGRREEWREAMQQLARMDCRGPEAQELLKAIYPDARPARRLAQWQQLVDSGQLVTLQPEMIAEIEQDRADLDRDQATVEEIRRGVYELYVVGKYVPPAYRGTRYALLDAVTTAETWRRGRQVGQGLLFGQRGQTIRQAHDILLTTSNARAA
jgi:hypothetical protein